VGVRRRWGGSSRPSVGELVEVTARDHSENCCHVTVGVGLLNQPWPGCASRAGRERGKSLGREIVSVPWPHLADHPIPERDRLRCGVVDAEDLDARSTKQQNDVAQSCSQDIPVIGTEC